MPVADVPCDAEPEVMTTAAGVDFVRTPDACFDGLPDWPYEPHYVEIDGLRQAYVDEGPAHGDVVLLLHGQPSWSYLHRDMIAVLSDAGHRVIAMDHLGMGRSDKPVDLDAYSYLGHNERLEVFIAELGLTDINVFVQDWGSLIGLRVAGLNPELFASIAIGDGMLPVVPEGIQPFPTDIENPDELADLPSPFAAIPEQQVPFFDGCELIVEGGGDFGAWIRYSMTAESFLPSEVVEAMTWFDLSPEEEAAYDAPYPSRIYMGGPRSFPSLVNELGGQNTEAWAGLTAFDKPVLTLWAANDPGNLGQCATQENLMSSIPGARNQPHDRLAEASHFLQDDQGTELATRLVDWYANPGDPNADRIGFELLERMDDGTIRAWISTDPTMTIEDFDAIEAPANWIKNQPREGSSGDSTGRFLGSPGSEGTIVYEDFFGSTWFHSATVIEIGVPVDAEGVLRGAMVQKFHEITYEPGSSVVALVSPDGDRYIRIGRDAGRTSDDPTLPTGWTLDEVDLPDGLTTLLPPDGTLVIRTDNEDSFQGPVADLP